jgi:site-specific recombinase XerD
MIASLELVSPVLQHNLVEEELSKDIWDVHFLPGVRYAPHSSAYILNFTRVTEQLRPLLKRYFRWAITKYSLGDCRQRLQHLREFTDFYVSLSPDATDFCQLKRTDIERYLVFLQSTTQRGGKPTSARKIWRAVSYLRSFLEYLERTQSAEAPCLPVAKLVWEEDRGTCPLPSPTTIKYIPQAVLLQLEKHMHALSPTYLPVVIVLRASGWRISDVLNLRYNTCLQQTSSGWWLCGDIMKTQVLEHKVPISDEIAAFISAQCQFVQQSSRDQENPQQYLFPAQSRQRQGHPLAAKQVLVALKRLAQQCEIRDEDGSLFHFKTHAFRHTKAVELINNGMSLVHVQRWLAHLSPEMTLIYAKILDTTLRKEWEQAFAKGAVRIDGQGQPTGVTTEQQAFEQEIEWEHIRHNLDAVRLADGYCFKPRKANCPTQDTPCYTCHHFCTTPDFLPQFEKQEQHLRELIELGEKAGSPIWVERNTQKLNRVLPVIQVLRKGELHHPAGKAMREYTPEEWRKQP